MKTVSWIIDDEYREYRAALVSIGALYEDYEGPMTDEMKQIAKKIIAEWPK